MMKQVTSAVLLMFASVSGFAEINTNRVHIDAPLTSVYQYITQPDKWHDWYPYSKSAETPGGSLKQGQQFSEVVTVNDADVVFNYEVVEMQTPSLWKVKFSSPSVIGSLQYQLQETIDGSLLTRTLEYYPVATNIDELHALTELAAQVNPTSVTALQKLRAQLESDWQSRPTK